MSKHNNNLNESEKVSQLVIPYLRNIGFSHIAGEVTIQSKGRSFWADLVVYRDLRRSEPYIVVEVKNYLPEKLTWLDGPVQQAFKYATALGKQVRYLLVSDGYEHHWFEISHDDRSITTLLSPPNADAQLIEGPLLESPLIPVTDPDQFLRLMLSILETIRLDMPIPGVEAATELNRILIAKLHDEFLASQGNEFRFGTTEVDNETAVANLRDLFDEAMAYHGRSRPDTTNWEISSAGQLSAIRILEPYSLSGVSSSVVGTLFWRIFPDLIGKTRDVVTTPFPLGEIVVQLGQPKEGNKVIDPVCGTGLFLIETYLYLGEQITSNQRYDQRQVEELLEETRQQIFGIEINDSVAELAATNMVLNGLNPTNIANANALNANSLQDLSDDKGSFDLVLMDPPIGRIRREDIQSNLFELAGSRSWAKYDALFIELGIKLLSQGGKLVALIPDNFLYASTPDRREARRWLLDNVTVRAIVSLPSGALAPAGHSGKTSILLLEKFAKPARDNIEVLVADLQSVGYDERGRLQPDNALPVLLKNIEEFFENGRVSLPQRGTSFRIWTVSLDSLSADRLDVSSLDPDRVTLTRQILHGQYPAKKLEKLVSISSGRNFKNYVQEHEAAAIVVLAGTVRELTLELANSRFIAEEDYRNASRSIIEPNDVLVTTSGHYLGRSAVYSDTTWPAVASPAVTILKQKSEIDLDPNFLAVVINSAIGREQIDYRKASSTARPFIRRSDLGEILIPLPPLDIQRAIANQSIKMLEKAQSLRRQASHLEEQATSSIVSQLLGVGNDE